MKKSITFNINKLPQHIYFHSDQNNIIIITVYINILNTWLFCFVNNYALNKNFN